jgi:Flp pilus assembly protein TadG
MVEFALVAPLLFVLIFGTIDFGRAFHYWNVTQQMANDGARLAAVNSSVPSSFTCPTSTSLTFQCYLQSQADTSELSSGGSSWLTKGAKVCITFPSSSTTPLVGDPVQVQITASYNWLPVDWYFSSSPPTTTTIAGTATMRLEAIPSYSAGCYQP